MKRLTFAPSVFMVAYCCAYTVVFAMDWPLFSYYPLHGNFSWGAQVPLTGAGPRMAWYGLMASAGAMALLAAICLPDKAAGTPFRNFLWVFPCAAMLVSLFLLKQFFA